MVEGIVEAAVEVPGGVFEIGGTVGFVEVRVGGWCAVRAWFVTATLCRGTALDILDAVREVMRVILVLLAFAKQSSIPAILDGVVGSARKKLGDFTPSVALAALNDAVLLVSNDDGVFFGRERRLISHPG